MQEVVPGVLHWETFHEGIGERVHSYYVVAARALIDPRVPEQGLEALRGVPAPRRALLTNRHHLRHSERFRDELGCSIHCHEAGLHEFADGGPAVEGFAWGDELAPGIRALEVGVLCPEETALLIGVGDGLVAIADAVVRDPEGRLAFVPDELLGDDPAAIRAGLRESLARLLDQRFEGLLLAHGAPRAAGGRAELEAFARGVGDQELLAEALAAEAEGQRLLLAGDASAAAQRLRAAAERYRRSWELAGPAAFGRLIGMLKAAVIAGDGEQEAAYVRGELAEQGETPPWWYARGLAALVEGDDDLAARAAAGMRAGSPAFGRAADAMEALPRRDADRYASALRAIVEDFEGREEHLTGVAIADTALVLERLAQRRGLAVRLASALLP